MSSPPSQAQAAVWLIFVEWPHIAGVISILELESTVHKLFSIFFSLPPSSKYMFSWQYRMIHLNRACFMKCLLEHFDFIKHQMFMSYIFGQHWILQNWGYMKHDPNNGFVVCHRVNLMVLSSNKHFHPSCFSYHFSIINYKVKLKLSSPINKHWLSASRLFQLMIDRSSENKYFGPLISCIFLPVTACPYVFVVYNQEL